jgi:CBS domain-containing protein/anti-sigma regulatory factor (Ser/Thr protein kinase)
MYQIKVREVMTTPVVCFSPAATFREIQLCMKEKKFSGTPITENGELVGIISIDDIISAFDHGAIDEPVGPRMARNVITVPQNYSVIAASNIFEKFHYGRLPVVEAAQSRKVVGVLTNSDILSHLLMAVNSIAERFEREESASGNILRRPTDTLRFELVPDNFDLAGLASTAVKKHLQKCGVNPAILRRIAVICYEAEMNVIIHSMGGYMEVQLLPDRVRILVVDEGPGIPDVEKAMEPGYTTANEKIRALGFGAGIGLSNMKRCADQFSIRSSMETGTEVEAVVLINPEAVAAPVLPGKPAESKEGRGP